MRFLEHKKLLSNDSSAHYDLLKNLWFDFYPRKKGTNSTSSGFEHVFVTELNKKKVTGTHNWIYFANAETSGDINYKGWLKSVDLNQVRNLKFKFPLNF